jgi:glycerol-3-phosphate dehydrogenase subunit C
LETRPYCSSVYSVSYLSWVHSRLMARAKAKQVKENRVSLGEKLLGNPDAVGKVATKMSSLANWAMESKLHRRFMESLLDIHKDKKLPPFASKSFAAQFASRRKTLQGEPAGKIAYFSTCYINYNQPEIGVDTLEVMAHNNVDVAFAYERCCGMPLWHNGDMEGATVAARQNVRDLVQFVDEGRKIVATNPTCSQMIRVEYPRLLGTDDAKKVAAQTTDPMEFLATLAAQGKLNKNFKTGAGKVNYHMPCHLRAQNVAIRRKTCCRICRIPK